MNEVEESFAQACPLHAAKAVTLRLTYWLGADGDDDD